MKAKNVTTWSWVSSPQNRSPRMRQTTARDRDLPPVPLSSTLEGIPEQCGFALHGGGRDARLHVQEAGQLWKPPDSHPGDHSAGSWVAVILRTIQFGYQRSAKSFPPAASSAREDAPSSQGVMVPAMCSLSSRCRMLPRRRSARTRTPFIIPRAATVWPLHKFLAPQAARSTYLRMLGTVLWLPFLTRVSYRHLAGNIYSRRIDLGRVHTIKTKNQ